jgi:hypothetical protein
MNDLPAVAPVMVGEGLPSTSIVGAISEDVDLRRHDGVAHRSRAKLLALGISTLTSDLLDSRAEDSVAAVGTV